MCGIDAGKGSPFSVAVHQEKQGGSVGHGRTPPRRALRCVSAREFRAKRWVHEAKGAAQAHPGARQARKGAIFLNPVLGRVAGSRTGDGHSDDVKKAKAEYEANKCA